MDCPNLPVFDLGSWSETLIAPLEGRRYPFGGTFELTERCNFNCVHCYINQPAGGNPVKANELTTAQVKQILDQVAEAGCMFLTLTGGEPLLRPDFPEIYRHARQQGLIISVYTNGALITPQIAELFEEVTPRVVDISLYGSSAETYQKVTRRPSSFDQVFQGIELLRERNVPFSLKTMILTINYQEFEAIRNIADQFGVKFRYDGLLWPRLDGGQKTSKYQLPPDELINIEFSDPSIYPLWIELAESHQGEMCRHKNVYNCGIGRHSFHIDAAGNLSGCIAVRRPSLNLLEMSFAEGWEKLGLFYKQERHLDTPCRTCTLNNLCNQCPGWSQAVFDDNETPVRLLCDLAYLRAEKVNNLELSEEKIEEMMYYE